MSLYDYLEGQKIDGKHPPFYALIQAAMRKADDTNLEKLRRAWPEVWDELKERYDTPGGVLASD